MSARRFPVMLRAAIEGPRFVPWSFVAPHEANALRNHGQSLEKLATRGGLSPVEIWAIVHDARWRVFEEPIAYVDAIVWLKEAISHVEDDG